MTSLNIRWNNQGSKKYMNRKVYDKEAPISSTKIVVLLSGNNLHFY